jgi:hypothetical protein
MKCAIVWWRRGHFPERLSGDCPRLTKVCIYLGASINNYRGQGRDPKFGLRGPVI